MSATTTTTTTTTTRRRNVSKSAVVVVKCIILVKFIIIFMTMLSILSHHQLSLCRAFGRIHVTFVQQQHHHHHHSFFAFHNSHLYQRHFSSFTCTTMTTTTTTTTRLWQKKQQQKVTESGTGGGGGGAGQPPSKRERPRKQQPQQQRHATSSSSAAAAVSSSSFVLEDSVAVQDVEEQEEVVIDMAISVVETIHTSNNKRNGKPVNNGALKEVSSPPPPPPPLDVTIQTEKVEDKEQGTNDPSSSSSLVEPLSSLSLLLHPQNLFNGTIPYPKSLSPSSIIEFQKCPQSFLFQYLYMIKQPTTSTLCKGSLCHLALQQIFDLPVPERTLQHLQNLFRIAWSKYKNNTSSGSNDININYQDLFFKNNLQAEVNWGREGLQLLENYYQIEDPRTVTRPNPVHRERWIRADLTVDPTKSIATGYQQVSNFNQNDNEDDQQPMETFLVRGIIDRLDMIQVPNTNNTSSSTSSSTTSTSHVGGRHRNSRDSSSVVLRLVDYKTGKAPHLKYSHAMNMKIIHEAFYQLKIYALLWRQQQQQQQQRQQASSSISFDIYGDDTGLSSSSPSTNVLSTTTATPDDTGIDLRFLRLFYLTSTPKDGGSSSNIHNDDNDSSSSTIMGPAKFLDMDLGETPEQRDEVLHQIHVDLSRIWNEIVELVSLQDAKAWKGCNRSFCYCHTCRARFVPGTVWEPPPTSTTTSTSSTSTTAS